MGKPSAEHLSHPKPVVETDEPERVSTQMITIACAALFSDVTGEAMQKHLCRWLDRTLLDDDGLPIKHPLCPIMDYATNECAVTSFVAYHSYELAEKELVGKSLQDGVEVDIEAVREGLHGSKVVSLLQLKEEAPDLDDVFTNAEARRKHQLGKKA